METRLVTQRQPASLAQGCPARVHIIDDDAAVRAALVRLLRSRDYEVIDHPSAESFLATHDPDEHGCILLDVSMPGLDGPGLQRRLQEEGDAVPVIFLTGSADVPVCAAAMRNGAVDFLTKPVDEEELVRAITMALQHDSVRRVAREQKDRTDSRLSSLTPREREVLDHVMNGRLNKQIASDLGTAEKTVKVHRARAMEKMHVRSVAELVRMVERSRFGMSWLG
jgi:FixJ family two-component response regulator